MAQEDFFKNIIGHVARKCDIRKWSYVIQKFEETVENYFGILVPVVINAKNGGRTVNVIVKYAPEEHHLKNLGVVTLLFTKEIYFYSKFIPLFQELKTNIDLESLIPRCFYTTLVPNKEVLVIEDMRSKGFMKHAKMFLDSDHVEIALKSMARFHALTMMIQTNTTNIFDDDLLRPHSESFPMAFIEILKATLDKKQILFKNSKYENFINDVVINFEKYVKQAASEANRLIYGHGDFWKENIMFKYENNRPIQACLLDFQGVRQISPAQDFLYFIMNSTESQVRRENYKNFLHIYYKTLQQTLHGNGVIYPIELFQKDLTVVAPCCFIILFMSFSLWLGVEIEHNAMLKNKNSCLSKSETDSKEKSFKRVISDIIDDIVGFGFMRL